MNITTILLGGNWRVSTAGYSVTSAVEVGGE
jgi:hypothetical protein